MNYTLDSLEHAKAVLSQKNPGKKIYTNPILIGKADQDQVTQFNPNKWYFGITTIGTAATGVFYFDSSQIILQEHNQIILLFQYMDLPNNSNFQFRGHQITIQ